MPAEEHKYWQDILYEQWAETFFLPLGHSVTYEAMRHWGGYDMIAASLAALTGALLACMMNRGFGQLLSLIRTQNKHFFPDERYERYGRFMQRYGIWALPFFWLPLGSLPVIAAGFFKIDLRWVMLLCTLGYSTRLVSLLPPP